MFASKKRSPEQLVMPEIRKWSNDREVKHIQKLAWKDSCWSNLESIWESIHNDSNGVLTSNKVENHVFVLMYINEQIE
jgi:hypothetical protein